MSDITIKTTVCDGVYKCLLTSHPMRALEGLSSEADEVHVAMGRLWESIAYYETSTHKPRPRPKVEDVHTIGVAKVGNEWLAKIPRVALVQGPTREVATAALLEGLRGEMEQ